MKVIACLSVLVFAIGAGSGPAASGQTQMGSAMELVGVATIAAEATDQTGLTDFLTEGIPHNQIGGISAIGRIGKDRYLLLEDRGPMDGEVPFQCRFLTATITIDQASRSPVHINLDTTTILSAHGLPYVGLSSVFKPNSEFAGRFDPEGICLGTSTTGTEELVYISDEYGPQIAAFDIDGQKKSSYELPAELFVSNPGVDWHTENGNNTSGRQSNRGMEGLTITPGGRYLVGIMQSPLLQDGQMNEKGFVTGVNVRIVRIDRSSGDVAQFVYQLEDSSHMISEILAISETQFLVIDRDGAGGELASKKMINLVDISAASELPLNTVLPPFDLPASIRPVSKSSFLDLLDKKYGLAGNDFPAKIEGLCFGPELADGRRTLLVVSDNDFLAGHPSQLMVFALPEKPMTAAVGVR